MCVNIETDETVNPDKVTTNKILRPHVTSPRVV